MLLCEVPSDEGCEHQHRALREVHDASRAPDHDQGERHRGVDHAVADTAQREVEEFEHRLEPQVGVSELLVRGEIGRLTLCHDFPEVEHDRFVGDRQRTASVLLHEDDGEALFVA